MNLVFVDEGLIPLLRKAVGGPGDGVWYKLITSDTTPSPSIKETDLTYPAGAWAEKELDETDFVLEQVVARVGSIQAPDIVFTNTSGAGVDVYGYAILSQDKSTLLGLARFDNAPETLANNGSKTITPVVGDYSDKTAP